MYIYIYIYTYIYTIIVEQVYYHSRVSSMMPLHDGKERSREKSREVERKEAREKDHARVCVCGKERESAT